MSTRHDFIAKINRNLDTVTKEITHISDYVDDGDESRGDVLGTRYANEIGQLRSALTHIQSQSLRCLRSRTYVWRHLLRARSAE